MTTAQRLPTLSTFWPLFLLGQAGQPAEGTSLLDVMYPEDLGKARELYLPIFQRVDLTAAVGLALTSDEVLGRWMGILRQPILTGDPAELMFLPTWCWADGVLLTGITALFALDSAMRLDVFMAAMHTAGES